MVAWSWLLPWFSPPPPARRRGRVLTAAAATSRPSLPVSPSPALYHQPNPHAPAARGPRPSPAGGPCHEHTSPPAGPSGWVGGGLASRRRAGGRDARARDARAGRRGVLRAAGLVAGHEVVDGRGPLRQPPHHVLHPVRPIRPQPALPPQPQQHPRLPPRAVCLSCANKYVCT